MDLTTITAGLGSIKSAMDIAKALKDSDLSLEKAETKLQLAELVSTLADAKMQIADIQDLLLLKDQENRQLQEQLNLKATLQYEKPYYWKISDEHKDGPFCQKCYDVNDRLVRLQGGENDKWVCFECESIFYGKGYQKPPPRTKRKVLSNGISSWNI